MKVLAVCTAVPERLPGKPFVTGINKRAVLGAVTIDANGLQGDAICNRKYHGGDDQAVYIEGSLSLDQWTIELGLPLAPGHFGENLIIGNLDNTVVAVGDRFSFGDVLLEVTAPRMPCATFAARMGDPQFVKRYRKAARPGFYCRVIRPGGVESGMNVSYSRYNGPKVLMTEMMKDFGRTLHGETLARYLAAPIHGRLRTSLETGKVKF
jgi:MOSC domain-containing protein YiiM